MSIIEDHVGHVLNLLQFDMLELWVFPHLPIIELKSILVKAKHLKQCISMP